MNVTFIRQWIAALRSGEYEQTRGIHKCGNTYCVLGVGFDLCPGHQWIPMPSLAGEVASVDGVVPPLLMKLSGLSSEQLSYMAFNLNDSGWSFSQIADHLEAMLPKETFAQELYEKLKDQSLIETPVEV